MMRDARINMIGEGANDVLKAFIAVVGMRGVGEHLKGVLAALKHPLKEFGTLWNFGRSHLAARFSSPEIPVQNRATAQAGERAGGAGARFRPGRHRHAQAFPQEGAPSHNGGATTTN